MKALLGAGADPNGALPSGSRPLLVAIANKAPPPPLTLLEGGAVIDRGGSRGQLATAPGGPAGQPRLVKALLARKMDPEHPDARGECRRRRAECGGARCRGGGGRRRRGAWRRRWRNAVAEAPATRRP